MSKLLTVVTGADSRYKNKIIRLLKSIPEGNQIGVSVYDLGGLGIGIPWRVKEDDFRQPGLMKCSFKPDIIRDAMVRGNVPTHFICWIDADCKFQCELDAIEKMLEGPFDIAVTVKRHHEIVECADKRSQFFATINAGVVFLRWTAADGIASSWGAATGLSGGYDQVGLSLITGNNSERHGLIRSPCGIVKPLRTDEWNCYYRNELCESTAKIVHYKGGKGDPLND